MRFTRFTGQTCCLAALLLVAASTPTRLTGAPIPKDTQPTPAQLLILDAVEELKGALTLYSADLITLDESRLNDSKATVAYKLERAKRLVSLTQVIKQQNKLTGGSEEHQKLIAKTLETVEEKLGNLQTTVKADLEKESRVETLKLAGQKLLEAKIFTDLDKRLGKRPAVVIIEND